MPKAAAVYCRISDDRTGEQAGVARQEEDCLALAERRGWPVASVYIDNDLSAWNDHSRPQYQRLLGDIGAGTVDAGVIPVESSLLGTIRENLDLLWTFDLPIAGEVSVPVRMASASPSRAIAASPSRMR